MDILNLVDKIYTATINFVQRFNSEKCCLPQTLNLSAILKKTTTKKAGIYRYTTRERDIRKIRHSGPGCSGVWILRVF